MAQPRWFASHELRTPLQAIKGGVEMLLEERAAGRSAVQVEALGLIAAATGELEHCVTLLGELAALPDEPALPLERQRLGVWLGSPEIGRHLRPTSQLAAADLDVLLATPLAGRGLARLAAVAASDRPAAALAGDLAAVDAETCTIGLSIGPAASGAGAIAWQLATALFALAGASLRPQGAATTLLVLRRAGCVTT